MKANHNTPVGTPSFCPLLIKSKIQNNESKSQQLNYDKEIALAVNQVKDTK